MILFQIIRFSKRQCDPGHNNTWKCIAEKIEFYSHYLRNCNFSTVSFSYSFQILPKADIILLLEKQANTASSSKEIWGKMACEIAACIEGI